jgi:hypothetical protein
MRIVWMFTAALVAAVGIGLGAAVAADDSPSDCVAIGDQLGTVSCPEG